MKAILRDSKGWSKVMEIPHMMREIRLPLYRKSVNIWEVSEGSWVTKDKSPDLVIFEYAGRGLNDAIYYQERDGARSTVSSPFGESQAGAIPAPVDKVVTEVTTATYTGSEDTYVDVKNAPVSPKEEQDK